MLTRQQIQRLAQRYRIGMQAQERDYVEHLALYLLYTRSQDFVFKGGTALRLAYRGNRYSEDLDFNAPESATVEEIQARWQAVADGLADYGIGAELRRAWQSTVGYSVDLSFRGPLYDGRDRTKSKIRLDMNLRSEVAASQPVLVSSEYADVRPFVVTVITREHLFAEKVRALLVRGKPRDLYDVWLMLGQGLRPDLALLQQKLASYDLSWSPNLLEEAMDQVEPNWEQDLRPLLTQSVPYAAVRQAVQAAMADVG
jgi:predicted nucleotidyltransferase component of viral defense system